MKNSKKNVKNSYKSRLRSHRKKSIIKGDAGMGIVVALMLVILGASLLLSGYFFSSKFPTTGLPVILLSVTPDPAKDSLQLNTFRGITLTPTPSPTSPPPPPQVHNSGSGGGRGGGNGGRSSGGGGGSSNPGTAR